MRRRSSDSSKPILRRLAPRAALAAALALPAAAVAAEPAVAPSNPNTPAGPPAPTLLVASAEPGPRLLSQVRRASRPEVAHPLPEASDYGDAQAAFGNARGRPHEGQDIFAPAGMPVRSPARTVALERGSDGGRGNWLALYDPRRDLTYVYFHLVEQASVAGGEKVAPGEKVGAVGCTGSCFGDHLHFEVRDGRDPYGEPRDPMPLLERWAQAEKRG
jgi:murein DD-endopeptidase MepM/ murein hydrolase activator NlpD